MIESPRTNHEGFKKSKNSCPKCHSIISAWDYMKPGARKANRIKCNSCGSILRYDLSSSEVALFGGWGFALPFIPAYYLWPPTDFIYFSSVFIAIVLLIIAAISIIEVIYVRKYHLVEYIE